MGGDKTQQLGNAFAIGIILRHALLDNLAKLLPERFEFCLFLLLLASTAAGHAETARETIARAALASENDERIQPEAAAGRLFGPCTLGGRDLNSE